MNHEMQTARQVRRRQEYQSKQTKDTRSNQLQSPQQRDATQMETAGTERGQLQPVQTPPSPDMLTVHT